jgi:hypothetical protein
VTVRVSPTRCDVANVAGAQSTGDVEPTGEEDSRRGLEPNGSLTDATTDPRGQAGARELFAGGIGFFKKSDHVEHDNPTAAAEIVLVADPLMRVLDGIESSSLAKRSGRVRGLSRLSLGHLKTSCWKGVGK